jgi:hypothetical protein
MPTFITIGEATTQSSYSHAHISWLVRTGKIKGKKSGAIWLVDTEDLQAYERRMEELGVHKHDPTRSD